MPSFLSTSLLLSWSYLLYFSWISVEFLFLLLLFMTLKVLDVLFCDSSFSLSWSREKISRDLGTGITFLSPSTIECRFYIFLGLLRGPVVIYLTVSSFLWWFAGFYSFWALFWLLSIPRDTFVRVEPSLFALLFAVVVLGLDTLLTCYSL